MTLTLHAAGLAKAYATTGPVLRDVDVVLSPGEVLAVTAAPGAGKSTLARCLAGAYRPDAGSLRLIGPDGTAELAGAPALALAWVRRHHVRLLDGRLREAPREDAAGCIARALERRGTDPATATGRAHELLAGLGLARQAETAAGLMPSHARRAIAIARGLLDPPPVLVLDEPVRGVDASAARKIWDLTEAAVAAGCAVLVTGPSPLRGQTYELEDGRLR